MAAGKQHTFPGSFLIDHKFQHLHHLISEHIRVQLRILAFLFQEIFDIAYGNIIDDVQIAVFNTRSHIRQRKKKTHTPVPYILPVIHIFDLRSIFFPLFREKLIVLRHNACKVVAVFSEEKIIEDIGILKNSLREKIPYGQEMFPWTELPGTQFRQILAVFVKILDRGEEDQFFDILKIQIDG